MRLLHTSDWHLGHSLYGYDRTEEHAAVLDSIIEIAVSARPDIILICGDIFDSAQQGAGVQKLLVDKIDALVEACPDTHIIMTAGNHDSASRHEAFRQLWLRRGVNVIGTAPEKDNPDKLIIQLDGIGTVVACPFLHPRFIPEDFYAVQLQRALELTPDGLPVIMMAHLSVSGSESVGHKFSVGNIDSVSLENLGEGYDYLALGHIHRPQTIGRDGRARYCGTPIAISFDEPAEHGVTLVEINHHGDRPKITHIPVPQPVELITIPAHGSTSAQLALGLLEDFPSDKTAYIRLNVSGKGPVPVDLNEKARAICASKAARFCLVNYTDESEAGNEMRHISVSEFKDTSPIEIARNFFTASGMDFDPEMEDLMNSVLAQVQDENSR